jgi:hypothetical protein
MQRDTGKKITIDIIINKSIVNFFILNQEMI